MYFRKFKLFSRKAFPNTKFVSSDGIKLIINNTWFFSEEELDKIIAYKLEEAGKKMTEQYYVMQEKRKLESEINALKFRKKNLEKKIQAHKDEIYDLDTIISVRMKMWECL